MPRQSEPYFREQTQKLVLLHQRKANSVREARVAISQLPANMDTKITTLELKLTKARKIKQAMMQELLTGRIRLL